MPGDPISRPANVPGRQIADELLDAPRRGIGTIVIKRGGDFGGRRLTRAEKPAVKNRPAWHGIRRPRLARGGQLRVTAEKHRAVEELAQHPPRAAANPRVGHPDRSIRPGRSGEVPPDGIGTVPVDQREWRDEIALLGAHRPAARIEYVATAQTSLNWRPAEHQRPDRQQGVVPTADLRADRDKQLAGPLASKSRPVPHRRAVLRERHRSGVVGRVDDVGHSPGLAAAGPADDFDAIDDRPVRVRRRRSRPASSDSSVSELTQVRWPSPHFQIGRGTPSTSSSTPPSPPSWRSRRPAAAPRPGARRPAR